MDPVECPLARTRDGLPRTRGDGPWTFIFIIYSSSASPHTRGWTRVRVRIVDTDDGFPAHAGMDPPPRRIDSTSSGLPRTRGDGPSPPQIKHFRMEASPHTRGWTRRLSAVGRVVRASPHTRGWTLERHLKHGRPLGFPAHAGMDPRQQCRGSPEPWLPRTRGDGPDGDAFMTVADTASPHTRGWTHFGQVAALVFTGFPAHAGMDPRQTSRPRPRARLPRTRGDGPEGAIRGPASHQASPHTRGWTQASKASTRSRSGFPAHAGMDPSQLRPGHRNHGLPRTRGDGPESTTRSACDSRASPHTRGWTLPTLLPSRPTAGFPAHAGMDPVP